MMDTKWIFALIYLLCAALVMVPGRGGEADLPKEPQTGQESGDGMTEDTVTGQPLTSGEAMEEGTEHPEESTGAEDGTVITEQTEDETHEPVSVTVYLHDQKRTVEMELEEYVMRVVMAEMPYTFDAQALRAQAVAARSYCLYRIGHGTDHAESGGEVCDDYSHCMALMTKEGAMGRWGEEAASEIEERVRDAIRDTAGQVLIYDGEIIAAIFHASSTGRTENAKAVWGNEYPYLVSVESIEEPRLSEMTVSLTELAHLLKVKGTSDFAASLWDGGDRITLKHNESGRIEWISYGGYKMSGTQIRAELGLKSTDFSTEVSENGGLVTFTVTGSGHGIGMSQYGAQAMAEGGSTYEEILSHYYRGTELCLWKELT